MPNKKENPPESSSEVKNKKPSLVIKLFIFVVVAALISLGSVFAFIKIQNKQNVVEEKVYSIPDAAYNLKGGSFLKLSIGLGYTEDDVLAAIEKDIAVIKDAIILKLSDKTGTELQDSSKKELLKKELLDKLNTLLIEYNGDLKDNHITNIYFDTFLIS